jgi:hypothetical protein
MPLPFVVTWASYLFVSPMTAPATFAAYGRQALNNLLRDYYADGKWNATPSACPKNHVWG